MYDFQFPNGALTAWVLIYQTCTAIDRAKERQLAKVGLTPEKLDVLWTCRDYPAPVTPTELSRALSRQSQSVAGLLTRMEREGLVKRVPKRDKRLFVEVQITAKGEEILRPGLEMLGDLMAEILSGLTTEELEQLQEVCGKLRQNALEQLQMELVPPPG